MIRREGNQAQQAVLPRLLSALTHRGPDGEGVFVDGPLAMGMRRLSIIDVDHGWQPLYNEDKSLALIANGEIYNYLELRAALKQRGHKFRTGSDCETILHLYEEMGEDCVHQLRGMFAFALWDSRRSELLIVRDRIGEKPLYLVEREGEVVFSSELKALIRAEAVPFRLAPSGVHAYFHYGYVPEPDTIVEGVRKLPAGHLLRVRYSPWQVEQKQYWSYENVPAIEGDPATRIREVLEEVAELTVRADVPVGVALSGGMDSSLIAILAARRRPGSIHAVSVGYEGCPRQDERAQAEQLASYLGMPFHQVELRDEEVVSGFPQMCYLRDDPIADISGSSYLAVMQGARAQGIPVMLMGHGGDELFWGYQWVRHALAAAKRKACLDGRTGSLRSYLRPTLPPRSLPGIYHWLLRWGGLQAGWREYQRNLNAHTNAIPFYDLSDVFWLAQACLPALYTSDFASKVKDFDPASAFTIPKPWPDLETTVTRLICQTYLLENGIAQGDRLSMAASVELRLPLVDYRLVETVLGLRKSQPDSALGHKAWLKAATRDLLPDFVVRRRKRGFTPPWRRWTRRKFAAHGGRLADGYLVANKILDPEAVRRLVRSPLGLTDAVPFAHQALILEMWCRAQQTANLTTDG